MQHEIVTGDVSGLGAASGGETVWEALRQGVCAYGIVTRRRLLGEVARHLRVTDDEGLAALRRSLEALEAAGDVLVGSGGRVAAAPLRVVRLPGREALLVGAAPARDLDAVSLREGAPRRFVWSEEASRWLQTERGACEVAAAVWARLDRAPEAGEALVAALVTRVQVAETTGTMARVDGVSVTTWQRYVPAATARRQGLGWREGGAPDGPALLRWREGGADWTFGWANPASWPRALHLTRDEATRLRFALDRIAGGGIPVSVAIEGERVSLRVEGSLPSAEYRYLAAACEEIARELRATVYRLPSAAWPEVAATLQARLGLRVA